MKLQNSNRLLRDLVQDFHKGAILLPQFQRDYVWRSAKIRNLLDSLLKGFPIGGFYLWRPSTGTMDAKPKAFGPSAISEAFEGYLIDGQQRLTSLEAAFALYSGEDRQGTELRCYLDLAADEERRGRNTRLFVTYAGNKSVARRVDAGDSTLVPVAFLLAGQNPTLRASTEKTLRLIPGWDTKRVETALERLDGAFGLLDQQVPCTTVSDLTDSEAVEVFSRLNKGGTALKQGDVRAAELARGDTVDVLRSMRHFVGGERPHRLGVGFSFAFRALVVFHRQSARFLQLKPDWMEAPGPHGRSLVQSWRATEKAMDAALTFVDAKMGWSKRALLPSANAVIVLAAALDKQSHKLSAADERSYRRWLCLSALRGVFQGSVETTIDRFHRAIRESKRSPAEALLGALKRDEARPVRSEELNRYAQPWGPATQVFHAWLVGQEAMDWLSGDQVDALSRGGNPSLPGGDLTVHHIFPRRVLADLLENPDEANCPANYALISRSTNAELGDTKPDEVLTRLTPEQRKPRWTPKSGHTSTPEKRP
jgi:hypothetical protein